MSYPLGSSLIFMIRLSLPALLLAPALAAATSARGASAMTESPWLQAISSTFVVLDMAEGDVDGDGKNESVVCYQDNPENPYSAGGVAILGEQRGALRPLFHVRLEETWCEQVQVRGRQVGMLLRSKTLDKQRGQLVWTYGKEIHWAGSPGHALEGTTITASSSLDGGAHGPQGVMDGDLRTSWAEGASGTGIGEKLTIKLPRAMDVAYVAIYPGHGGGARDFHDRNVVHRASIEARSAADLGDDVAGIDFSELGIDVGGDRVEFTLENRPQVTYIRIDKRDVSELELRVDSVYLGRRLDDTHIAELEIVPRLDLTETLDRARPLSAQRTTPTTPKVDDANATEEAPAPAPGKSRGDKALEALDAQGRGLNLSVEDL